MILENSLDRENFGYARILIADYHKEYPLPQGKAQVTCIWDPFAISQVSPLEYEEVEEIGQKLFPELDPHASLFVIQGNLGDLTGLVVEFAQSLMGGPRGADDDTYDYWPGAFEMLVELVGDLINLGCHFPDYYIDLVGTVVKTSIAVKGDPDEWEAPGILRAVDDLKAIKAIKDTVV